MASWNSRTTGTSSRSATAAASDARRIIAKATTRIKTSISLNDSRRTEWKARVSRNFENSRGKFECADRANRAVSHLVAVVVVAEVDGGGHSGGGAVGVGARVAGVADGDLVADVVIVFPLPVVRLVGGRLADRHERVGRR